jgi:3-methylcrotonyl-CoA carboxylase alpha subunit
MSLADKLPSVLVANRGEIALRVMKTARRLGLRTIAVYSDADRDAPFARFADEAHRIGPAPARDSYLRADVILDVARRARAACIHPGYGFLSENTAFSAACAEAGIVFVGPPASAIEAMGLKDAAKSLVEAAGVPVVPGYHGERQDIPFLKERAYGIGYPVLIKAVAGGGGKGMKRVDRHADFEEALASAQREAANAFGDARVLIEKYVTAPRHVEIQVFGDSHGNVVHLFERDCSAQRRHQKVIEEAPAPGMPESVRAAMGRAAVEAARAVGYIGAGTVEFIADGSRGLREDGFYFMEMNTRLQVEHPVTEAITGLDLVELQLRVAAGEPLPFRQFDLAIDGHAVEARLYAEDPEHDFLPSTGRLVALRLPVESAVLRVDAGVAEGGEVTGFYDPMIAKIIAHGPTRDAALDRLSAALAETVVAGPRTNAAFLRRLVNHPDFRAGRLDTGLIERNREALGAVPRPADSAALALGAGVAMLAATPAADGDPWSVADSFTLQGPRATVMDLLADGERHRVELVPSGDGFRAEVSGVGFRLERRSGQLALADDSALAVKETASGDMLVVRENRQTRLRANDPFDIDWEALDGGGGAAVKAPMHGKLIALFVTPGETVARGHKLAIVEAMKMEHALVAPRDGTVADVLCEVGQQVGEGQRIVTFAE